MRGKGKIGRADALVALGVIGIVLLLIVPLSPFVLDIFISLSIVLSIMTLLMTLYVEHPLDFSGFPTILLFITLFRLGLNIASTRMILTKAEAGGIIETFGDFVIQGNPLVGLILFALLTIINFVVVTKGAGRIAEVSARFTLESLPGKQMAIESDVSAGFMTTEEAKAARQKTIVEADFYGAMDGASKFVRGDAIAGIFIILINIVGGVTLGCFVKHLPLLECLHQFTRLTVGDGLVTQIPSLFISVGAGIIVSRASGGSVGSTISKQFFLQPKAFQIAGIVLFAMNFIPGMPRWVMTPIAIGLWLYGLRLTKLNGKNDSFKEKKEEKEEGLETALIVHPIEIQLGLQRITLAAELLETLPLLKRQVALRWGVIVPSLYISDNSQLLPKEYMIKLRGIRVSGGRVDSLEELTKNLLHVVESHLSELINRQDVARMVEKAKQMDLAVVEELIPDRLKPGQILHVLQNLLREKIPIRDFITILEQIADHIPSKGEIDIDELTEAVRKSLSRTISDHFFGENRIAHAILLDPKVEQMLQVTQQKGGETVLRPATAKKIASSLEMLIKKAEEEGKKPVILTQSTARRSLRQLLDKQCEIVPVLAFGEIARDIQISTIGTVGQDVLLL